jgi:quinol monooxygenase YgiN/ketosteroid isomerase-like protein
MPIYTIADYRVKASGVDKVRSAIEEFVPYVRDNERGTRLYEAWQQVEDPTRLAHFFIFEDEASHEIHSESAAVKRFEAAYRPELDGGNVRFTDYRRVATNQDDRAGEILRSYYEAAIKRDLHACRQHLGDDFVFRGLFRTYHSAEEYLADFKQLLQITRRLEVKSVVSQGADAVVLFELETTAPAAATTLVSEWHHVENGKISRVQSVFDGRPFEAMFASAGRA